MSVKTKFHYIDLTETSRVELYCSQHVKELFSAFRSVRFFLYVSQHTKYVSFQIINSILFCFLQCISVLCEAGVISCGNDDEFKTTEYKEKRVLL